MSDYNSWLGIKDKKIQKKLKSLSDEQKIENFASPLAFGTAGMRGKMVMGSGGINEVTVTKLALSTAKYMLAHQKITCVVCYDTRKNSKLFAHIYAKVLSNNNILVYLFKKYAPTPLCVFATRFKKAQIGVMITASHNKREFNGIKIYNSIGIQIDNQTQQEISGYFNEADEVECYNNTYNLKLKNIVWLKDDVLKAFLDGDTDMTTKHLKIVYTPLNGTGYEGVEKILAQNKFKFFTPKSQKHPDPNFSTCPYPNPEFIEAFKQSVDLAKKVDADVIIATDPDADRIGVMIKSKDGYKKLSGNELGYIFLKFLLDNKKQEDGFVVTSVVSSPLVEKICNMENIPLYKTLTGFKSLGEKTHELVLSGKTPLLVFEESCGYIVRPNTYDKDGIYAALLVCQIGEWLKSHGSDFEKYLNDIYEKYGYLSALGDSIVFEGVDSLNVMNNVINPLRANPIKSVGDIKIQSKTDYLKDDTGLDKQNFIEYRAGKLQFIIRPSGTEPKLKIYLLYEDSDSVKAEQNANNIMEKLKEIINERQN